MRRNAVRILPLQCPDVAVMLPGYYRNGCPDVAEIRISLAATWRPSPFSRDSVLSFQKDFTIKAKIAFQKDFCWGNAFY